MTTSPFFPMFRPWFPKDVRPWIFLSFALLFQLSGGVYFSNVAHMTGTSGLLREDWQFIAMCGVVGVNMPFPFIFRFKLRFTNGQILTTAALVVTVSGLLTLVTTNVPLLCALSYVAGFFKLVATFECFSNLRLWISPRQDFGVFLPTIYIVILGAMPLSNWMASQLTEFFGSWQAMHAAISLLMLALVLFVRLCIHPWRMMPHKLPLVSLDWLGCLLWSLVMLEVIWLFTYGEYYNWQDSPTWRAVLLALPLTLAASIGRMCHIRHPYLSPDVFRHWRLLPIMGMFLVAEVMNATPHVLQNTLTGGVLHWGWTATQSLYLPELLGYVGGCAFTIFWHRPLHQKYTRLLTLGFAALLLHQVLLYFYVSPELDLPRLYLPTFLRTFGYAIFFSTMTLYLKDLIGFPTFLMALTVSGFVRNGVVESISGGAYAYQLRRHIADNLSRVDPLDIQNILLVSVKQMYGWICLAATLVLLLMLLYDVQPVRSTMRRMRHPKVLARIVRRQLSAARG
ncbi:MAG: hypothetical protein IJ659_07815 [Alloprevotella sp.]|nr:hypothetical protein [Alloprevotella sp.]MBR1594660.1 hypothetical protein [Alloprevotella sp.]